jgi:hypothetical protein
VGLFGLLASNARTPRIRPNPTYKLGGILLDAFEIGFVKEEHEERSLLRVTEDTLEARGARVDG